MNAINLLILVTTLFFIIGSGYLIRDSYQIKKERGMHSLTQEELKLFKTIFIISGLIILVEIIILLT